MGRLTKVGLGLMVLAVMCWTAESVYYGGVSEDGVLQESLFLPLTWLFALAGTICVAAGLIRRR